MRRQRSPMANLQRLFLASLTLTVGSACAAAPALAHIVADPAAAPGGAYQVIRFRVGHGCGEAATTALRVETPAGLAQARPQPKPGWALSIAREPAAGGGEGRVAAVTWRGELPADQFDEFALLVKLPETPGPLYFPTVQTCGGEEAQWTEIPEAGETGLSHPAPAVQVTPATASDAHHH